MTEEIKVLKGISKGGETYDIDAKYWNGESSIKTINGQSLYGSGNLEISSPKHIFSFMGDYEGGYLVGRIEGSTTMPTDVGSIICVLNASGNDIEITSSTPLLFEVGDEYKEFTVSDSTESFTVKSSDSISFLLIDETTLSPIVPRTGGSSSPSMYAYGTCSTEVGIGRKDVTLLNTYSNFTVSAGSIVAVKFTNANSVATESLQLMVAGVTAQIKYLNAIFPSSQQWSAGSVVEFIYDGSAWQVLGNIRDNLGSDTKVTQTIVSTPSNTTYPVLYSATANKSTSSADAARFSSTFKYNPSTDTLSVGNISSNIPGVTDGGANLLGTCSDAANSSEKNINISGVNLTSGSRVWIYFTNGNSYLGNMTCTINHKGTLIEDAQISINNAVGSFVDPEIARYSTYNCGIVFGTGYYEFAVEFIDNVYYLRMTNNYIADSSPEFHIKTGSTTNHEVLITLTPGVHTVFVNPGITILAANTVLLPNKSYSFEFTSGSSAPTVSLPSDIKWANGTIPTWEANTTYHISIVNYCAVCASFKTVS